MTNTEPTDRQIVEGLARVCGYKLAERISPSWFRVWTVPDKDGISITREWNPLNSLEDVAECEAVVLSRGLWTSWYDEVERLLINGYHEAEKERLPSFRRHCFLIATAAARVRALACWEVLCRESEGK